jgi:hypothetical protein
MDESAPSEPDESAGKNRVKERESEREREREIDKERFRKLKNPDKISRKKLHILWRLWFARYPSFLLHLAFSLVNLQLILIEYIGLPRND